MSGDKLEFVIDGKDYDKLEKFKKKHKRCLEKHPSMTGAQYCYSFTTDSFGTMSSCKCVCGKSILMSSDYDKSFLGDEKINFRVIPEDAKTEEVVRILQSMHVRPGMYFGKQRSYITLRAFLAGYGAGTRLPSEEECYWSKSLGFEVDEEVMRMTEGKNYSDEEMFYKFFEAFDLVLKRDYPQYIIDMKWGDKVMEKKEE